MNFQFAEEQLEMQKMAKRFLESACGPEAVREAMETEAGYDPALWEQVAELGWPMLLVPEEHDGLGLSFVDLMPIMEESGRYLFGGPLFSTVCLATNALLLAADDAQKAEYLPAIGCGELTGTLALTERNGLWDARGVRATYTKDGDDYILRGEKRYVIDGHTAGLVLVAAREEHTDGTNGISLFAVPGDAANFERTWLPTVDQTRKQAHLKLDGVRVPKSARLGPEGGAWPLIRKTLDRASAMLACEQVGGAERCLDMSVEYSKERKQFSRPIGSFQAIKHKAADMLMLVESARSIAYFAGLCAAEDSDELIEAAASAQSFCSETYFHCAAEAIQIHGGVGFTWEFDCHLHFKRAKASESLLGAPAMHREVVAYKMGL